MTKINRRYIDKHYLVFVIRGILASIFGLMLLFNCLLGLDVLMAPIAAYLLAMGAIDAVGAMYNASKKHGWFTALIDAIIDLGAAASLLIAGPDNIVHCVATLSVYSLISGIIDLAHSFFSTVDPTDRFIRGIVGAAGCIFGFGILNAGGFEFMAFSRFFGAYTMIVGITSLIYAVHNRSQDLEDREARQSHSGDSKITTIIKPKAHKSHHSGDAKTANK